MNIATTRIGTIIKSRAPSGAHPFPCHLMGRMQLSESCHERSSRSEGAIFLEEKETMIKRISVVAFAALALAGCNISGTTQPQGKNIVAVQLGDGRTLFGDLQDKTLCHYVFVANVADPKTKKVGPQVVKGGFQYGGDGCLNIQEPILTTEKLQTTSPFYGVVDKLESSK